MLLGVPAAHGHGVIFEGVEVYRDAVRRANLILAAVVFVDSAVVTRPNLALFTQLIPTRLHEIKVHFLFNKKRWFCNHIGFWNTYV
jgi:hypothetical protein